LRNKLTLDKYKGILKAQGLPFSVSQLLMDFYQTLADNKKNIDVLYNTLTNINNARLTKVRIFDFIWWSFLKYENLKNDFPDIQWLVIER
jgi:hypothetical protein